MNRSICFVEDVGGGGGEMNGGREEVKGDTHTDTDTDTDTVTHTETH